MKIEIELPDELVARMDVVVDALFTDRSEWINGVLESQLGNIFDGGGFAIQEGTGYMFESLDEAQQAFAKCLAIERLGSDHLNPTPVYYENDKGQFAFEDDGRFRDDRARRGWREVELVEGGAA